MILEIIRHPTKNWRRKNKMIKIQTIGKYFMILNRMIKILTFRRKFFIIKMKILILMKKISLFRMK